MIEGNNEKLRKQIELVNKLKEEAKRAAEERERTQSISKFTTESEKVVQAFNQLGMTKSPMEQLADDTEKATDKIIDLAMALKNVSEETRQAFLKNELDRINKIRQAREKQIKQDQQTEIAQAILTDKQLRILEEKRRFDRLQKFAEGNERLQKTLQDKLSENIGRILSEGITERGRTSASTDAIRRGSIEAFRQENKLEDQQVKAAQDTANNTRDAKDELQEINRKLEQEGLTFVVVDE